MKTHRYKENKAFEWPLIARLNVFFKVITCKRVLYKLIYINGYRHCF